jgi:hypothetical protein
LGALGPPQGGPRGHIETLPGFKFAFRD